MSEEQSSIYIGKKATMNYVLATVLQFNQGANEVVIKARGRSISKAVDVVEISRNRFLTNSIEVSNVKIGTEEIGDEDKRNVSVIEITLRRKE